MNCDLKLTENSCRFCLGDSEENGTNISLQGSYFLVEKRLIQCKQVFDFLELKIDENNSPNVPRKICQECKKTIVAFYALRKNFLDNEAVLVGKLAVPSKSALMLEVEAFLKEHEHEKLIVKMYVNQLVIQPAKLQRDENDQRSPNADTDEAELLRNQDDLDMTTFVQTDDEDLMYETQHEEYLEQVDDDSMDYSNEDLTKTEEVQYELQVSKDPKQFNCRHCDRKFTSRSGRDTHTQTKHKAPSSTELMPVDEHEIEVDLEDGSQAKRWKCPICQMISKKKNHHQTHLIRHAIREKEEALKQGLQQVEMGAAPVSSEAEVLLKPDLKRSLSRVAVHNSSHVVTSDDHLSCSGCQSKFVEIEDARSHVQKYARTGMCTDAFCKDCSVVFSSLRLHKRHIEFHEISPIVASLSFPVCTKCQIVFGSSKDLEVHLETNHLCETDRTSQLEGAELLTFELQPDMSSEDYRCGSCIKTGSRDDVYLHIALFHGLLVCPIDKQDFARSTGYFLEHMKSKHPDLFGVELNFKCPHCAQNFSSKAARDDHCQNCESKIFHCTHCDKKFAFERQLKRHMALVKGIKAHKCEFCEKSFVNRTELNVHLRVHTNERPYVCSFPGCGKSFRTNSHRSAHMDTHNTEKNFKCNECEEVFQTRSLRRLHEKSHIIGSISCELCQKEFGQRSHYVRHINKVHHIHCTSVNLEETLRLFNTKEEVV